MIPDGIIDAVRAVRGAGISAGQAIKDNYIQDPNSGRMLPSGGIWDISTMANDARAVGTGEMSKDEYIRKSGKATPLLMGMASGVTGKTLNRVHSEDLDVMEKFVRAVRNKSATPQQQLDAARIAEHYRLPMPKSLKGLADTFENALSMYVSGLQNK